jgi:general stress protein CsbA
MLNTTELDQTDKSKYVAIVVSAIIAGAIVFVSQDVLEWMLGIDFDNPGSTTSVPSIVVTMLSKILSFSKFIGGGIIAVGVIVAVAKLSYARPKALS